MKLTMLRKERDELVETLRDSECDEFDAPNDGLLEDCCKGKRLEEFKKKYRKWVCDDEDEDDEGDFEWVSGTHKKFYQVCHGISELEQSEYKKAMGWNP